MARSMTGTALTQSLVKEAQEPILIIKIEWDSGTKYYCDKTYTFDGNVCAPIILSIGNCQASAPMSNIGGIATMSLTLDDTDGALKSITNSDEMEGAIVTVYHHFANLAAINAVILMKGKIVADIVWGEGDRTLTLSIESDITSKQFGFAATTGDWANLHEDAVGKPWPFVFGSPRLVPALRIYRPNRSVLAERIDNGNGSYKIKDGDKFPQGENITIDIGGMRYYGTFSGDVFTPTATGINIKIYGDEFV